MCQDTKIEGLRNTDWVGRIKSRELLWRMTTERRRKCEWESRGVEDGDETETSNRS